jgi:hypothetical protein
MYLYNSTSSQAGSRSTVRHNIVNRLKQRRSPTNLSNEWDEKLFQSENSCVGFDKNLGGTYGARIMCLIISTNRGLLWSQASRAILNRDETRPRIPF